MVVVHTLSPSTPEVEPTDFREFKSNLVYRGSARVVGATQSNAVSQTQTVSHIPPQTECCCRRAPSPHLEFHIIFSGSQKFSKGFGKCLQSVCEPGRVSPFSAVCLVCLLVLVRGRPAGLTGVPVVWD